MEHAASKQIPAIDNWFTWPPSEEPHLIGSKCSECGDYFFPKVKVCRNPKCMSTDVKEVLLSRIGTLYTYAINHYPAPPPYVPTDPFVPYATAVMELAKEKMKIQGLIEYGYDLSKLKIGMKIEVVLRKLYADLQGNDVISWMFRPIK